VPHIKLQEGIPGILGPMMFSPETAKPLNELAEVLLRAALVQYVKRDFAGAAVSDKMKALLTIAGKVQKGGKHVTTEDVERARAKGASDKEIHDTVLIAAAFCMYNRYVDGLATWAPTEPEVYRANGKRLAEQGYVASTEHLAAGAGD
jgi:alkylhydroperoxidase/carboxymuconolactone decarboxylase family protein YurZ